MARGGGEEGFRELRHSKGSYTEAGLDCRAQTHQWSGTGALRYEDPGREPREMDSPQEMDWVSCSLEPRRTSEAVGNHS